MSKVREIKDSRINVIELTSNSGSPAYPRNVGIDHAKGDFIAFLDSDDLWEVNKLEIQVESMITNKWDFSCSGYSILKDDVVVAYFTPPTQANYHNLLSNNSVGCLTAMVSTSLIGETRFPQCGHEDFSFWLKLLKKTNCVHGLKINLAKYNLVDGSVSSSKSKLIPFFWNIYRNEEGFSRTVSLYYCARYLINVLLFKYKKSRGQNG
ncbi:glycosyltransferase family 2 protein [Shewanella sp. Isolate7]|nr:glycosyltransferase family 2 protein [Shewanella sp. Isolate7]